MANSPTGPWSSAGWSGLELPMSIAVFSISWLGVTREHPVHCLLQTAISHLHYYTYKSPGEVKRE